MNEQSLARLRELLLNEFSEEELAALCQDIGVNYAELTGMGAYGKTRGLIETARAHKTMRALMARVRDLRPDAYRAARFAAADGAAEPASPRGMADAPAARTSATVLRRDATHHAAHEVEPAASVLTPQLRVSAIVVGVLVLAVAILTIVLPKPLVTPTGAISAGAGWPTGAAGPLFSPIPTALAGALTTPNATEATQPAHTAQPVLPAQSGTVAPAALPATPPAPQSTPTISESHPAAQAVRALNEQLIDFYTGKVEVDALRTYWNAQTYQVVRDFAYTRLRTKLGVDLAKGDALQVSLRYTRVPALVAQNGDAAQVKAREYWSYKNPRTNRAICETRDYTYTMIQAGDTYQVKAFQGKLADSACEK